MKLWILKSVAKANGFVIRARTDEDARYLASMRCGDEGGGTWTNPLASICEELIPFGEASIILRDFKAG